MLFAIFSMCDSAKFNLDINGDKDYSKDFQPRRRSVHVRLLRVQSWLQWQQRLQEVELGSEEDYSKDELDGNKDSSLDNEMYNGEESDGEESLRWLGLW